MTSDNHIQKTIYKLWEIVDKLPLSEKGRKHFADKIFYDLNTEYYQCNLSDHEQVKKLVEYEKEFKNFLLDLRLHSLKTFCEKNRGNIDKIDKQLKHLKQIAILSKNSPKKFRRRDPQWINVCIEYLELEKSTAPAPAAGTMTAAARVLKHITMNDFLSIKLSFLNGDAETVKMQNCPGCIKKPREGETHRWNLIINALQGEKLKEKEKFRVNDTFRKLLNDTNFSLWKNGKLAFTVKLPKRHETFSQKRKREYKEILPVKKIWTQENDE